MHSKPTLHLLAALVLSLSMLLPSPTAIAVATEVEDGIFFSADVTSRTNAVRRMALNGSGEGVVLRQLPLQQLSYLESENRFYGAALDDAIRRIDADGANEETLLAGLNGANTLRLDSGGGKMYWIDKGRPLFNDGLEIRRANLDGSNAELLVPESAGYGSLYDLTVSPTNSKLYVIAEDRIVWANLDGSALQVFATATGGVNPELYCLVIDDANGNIYWIQEGGSSGNAIFRANLDGTDAAPIVLLPAFPNMSCPALDAEAQELVWADGKDSTIKRADLDGGNVANIRTGVNATGRFQMGPNGYFYWSQSTGGQINILRVHRSQGDVETLAGGLTLLREMAVVPALGKFFWIDQGVNTMDLGRANLDGSGQETLRRAPRDVRGIGLDPQDGKLYMANTQSIARANLDGSGFETLVTGLQPTEALVLDLVNSKVYWSEGGSKRAVRRANLDGSQVEDVFVHSGGGSAVSFMGLALDNAAGKLYFSYYVFGGAPQVVGSIWRADLDGSNAEALVSGLQFPRGVALDPAGGKIYWTDSSTRKVQRADLATGANVEDLVATDLQMPHGLAVDVLNGHLYWADSGARAIKRASLSGANVSVLYSGPAAPQHLIVVASGGENGSNDDAAKLFLPIVNGG